MRKLYKTNYQPAEGATDLLPLKMHGEERLRVALEAARIGYWEWNIVTDRVTFDGYAESILGLMPGLFEGTYKAFLKLLHPDDRATVRQTMSQAFKERGEYRSEFRVVRPEGEVRWVGVKGRACLDGAGNSSIMVGVIVGADDVDRRGGVGGFEKFAEGE